MEDQFGRDPQVRYLRRVFAVMERKQAALMERLQISPHDYRLRRVRESALRLFEKAWLLGSRRGLVETEEEIGDLYTLCFAKMLAGNRIAVPSELLPTNAQASNLVREVSP